MKVCLSKDERFPVFDLDDHNHPYPGAVQVQVPSATVTRWARTIEKYDAVQREMKRAYDVAEGETE